MEKYFSKENIDRGHKTQAVYSKRQGNTRRYSNSDDEDEIDLDDDGLE